MKKYRFEQIAINCTEKKMPTDEDRLTYIGLEHLDTSCLTISRWGSAVPLKGEKLVMHKGDVLLGKRNAYLRRAAIAPHDGIFSAHGMVLRPREEVIDKTFFPLFISSDYFFDEAIRISVGSLSPTVNWKDLRVTEFELPDLETQRKLAGVLWSIHDTMEAYKRLISATDELVKSRFIEWFGAPWDNPKNHPVKLLSEIASYWNGLTYKPSDVTDSGTIVLRSGNIQEGRLAFDDVVRVQCEIRDKIYVKENDILMCSRNGSAELVGKVALIPRIDEPMAFGAFMMIIRSDYYDYLLHYFRHPAFRAQIDTGTATINQITRKMLDKIMLPVPSENEIRQFAAFARQSDQSKFELEQTLSELTAAYKRIISEQLG